MTGAGDRREAARRMRWEIGVWLALILLLAATLGLAYLPMGPGNLVAALAISVAKLALVGLFFMHLRTAGGLIRLSAAAGLVFVTVMFALTLADILFRLPAAWP